MDKYLVVITTILVFTQIARLIQNTIQLRGMKKTHNQNVILVEDWSKVIEKFNNLIINLEKNDKK